MQDAITTAINAPRGSPDPLIISWPNEFIIFPFANTAPKAPIKPTTPDESVTSFGDSSDVAIPIPITGPVRAIATGDIDTKKLPNDPGIA